MNDDLEKKLSKIQKMAKLNPLAFAQNFASRKDSKDKQQLRQQIDSQEEEFKITNETLRVEIYQLMNENDKLREWIGMEGGEVGSNFLKNIDQIPSPIRRKSSIVNSTDEVHLSPSHLTSNPSNDFELGRAVYEKEKLQAQVLDLQTDLKQLSEEKVSLATKYEELKGDLASLKTQLSDVESLAEERQVLIDAMHDNLEESRCQFKSEVESLKKKLSVIPELKSEIERLETLVSSNSATIDTLESERNVLSNQVESLNDQLERESKEFQEAIKSLEIKHQEAIRSLSEEHDFKVQTIKDQLFASQKEVSELTQKVKDSVEERKIHDKKGVMIMRELKKTLASEKKRAENLQEKLREVLNDPGFGAGDLSLGLAGSGSHSSPGTSTPVKSPSSSRDLGQAFSMADKDTGSVGSWSFISSFKNNKKTSPASNYSNGSDNASGVAASVRRTSKGSPAETTDDLSEAATLSLLESENGHLVQRITDLQQEKWKLEERVNILSIEVEALKKDNQIKQEVIEYYCMEGRAGATVSTSSSSSNHHYSSSSPSLSSVNRRVSSSHVIESYLHPSLSTSGNNPPDHQPKLSVKKVVNFIKDKGQSMASNSDQHMSQEKEINKRLQRMLEETLTKNMFLQKDLEFFSNEVEKLRNKDGNDSNASSASSAVMVNSVPPSVCSGASSSASSSLSQT
jgi:hypothetical protein